MQVPLETDIAAHLDHLIEKSAPGGRGLQAWMALLRAHATLLRKLETDLEAETGLALADFDVLAQLAAAGGSLTDAGVARLTDTAPVHVRGVHDLFVAQLDDEELAVLETALAKVTLDCGFG